MQKKTKIETISTVKYCPQCDKKTPHCKVTYTDWRCSICGKVHKS